jgi:hypothetical protein
VGITEPHQEGKSQMSEDNGNPFDAPLQSELDEQMNINRHK